MESRSALDARPCWSRHRIVVTACLTLLSGGASVLRSTDFSPSGEGGYFLRGDADQSGNLEITDAIFTLNYLFLDVGGDGPYCMDAMDADDDGVIVITDGVAVLLHLFAGTFAIPEPHGAPGTDPTEDALDCDNGRFARLRREVFAPSCATSSCHSGTAPAGDLDLSGDVAFCQLVHQPASGPAAQSAGLLRVKPRSPEDSFLLRKITGTAIPDEEKHVPDLAALVAHEHLELLESWIRDGAIASVADDVALPPPALGQQIVIPDFSISKEYGQEVQRNYYFQLKNAQTMWVNRVEFASTPGIDHWNFFPLHSGDPPPFDDGSFEDHFPLVTFRDWSLRASSQAERLDWKLPAGVGMQFAPRQHTLSQIHFTNYGEKLAPLGGRAVFNLHAFEVDPRDPPVPLGSLIIQDRRIRLPRGASSAWDYGVTLAHLGHDVPVKLAAIQGHFHWRGESFEIRLWDGLHRLSNGSPAPGEFDRMGPENTIYLSENGEEPPFLDFGDDGPEVPAGWGLIYRSSFTNPDGDLMCFGSRAEYQEHSIVFAYFYPGPLLRFGFLYYPPDCEGQGCTVICR